MTRPHPDLKPFCGPTLKSESLSLASLSPGTGHDLLSAHSPHPCCHPASMPVPRLLPLLDPQAPPPPSAPSARDVLFSSSQKLSPEGPLRDNGLPLGPGLSRRAVATGEGRARCLVLENSVKIPPHFSLWEKHTAAAQTEIKLIPSVTSDPWPRALPMTPPLNLTFTHPNHPIPRPSADA